MFPIAETDELILEIIENDVLSPDSIESVLASVQSSRVNQTDLEEQLRRTADEMARLTEAIKQGGGEIPSLVSEMKKVNAKLTDLQRRLTPREEPNKEELRRALEQRATDWRRIMRSNIVQALMVLKHLMDPLMVEGEPRPSYIAPLKPEGFLVGLVQNETSPAGFEPALPA